jgi:fumarate reductase subunit C
MPDLRLFMAQRLSALIMAPLTLAHLAVMIYAIRGGLSAEEILSRTRGSAGWALFYSLFVAAVSVHAALGLRVIAHEWLGLRGRALPAVGWAVFALLALPGAFAVWAVTAP